MPPIFTTTSDGHEQQHRDDRNMMIPDYGWFYVLVVLMAVWVMRP
ncbi:hypothetical protein [Endozoicomonas elysicola]|nr:hypothetical protein [Endozoicomonas elysicola]